MAAIKVPLIMGGSVEVWCDTHLIIAKERLTTRLGKGVSDFIFSGDTNARWFWSLDIRDALQAAFGSVIGDIASNLYDVHSAIPNVDALVRVTAPEYKNAIAFVQADSVQIMALMQSRLSPGYLAAIGPPLGEATFELCNKLSGSRGVSAPTAEHLICMALSANRAKLYKDHEYASDLIKVERTIWAAHKEAIA